MTPPSTRTELINAVVERIGARSFLEIGVHDGRNLANVRCSHKVGVDPKPAHDAIIPLTSDAFFASNTERFDVIFIDGLHEAEQVHRDIVNALAALNDGGIIICHDMNPWTERLQHHPRPPDQRNWTGDGWKSFVRLRAERGDLAMCVIDIETGCALIRRGPQKPLVIDHPLTWHMLKRHRRAWLNLVTVEHFDEWLRSDMEAPLLAPSAPSLQRTLLKTLVAAAAPIAAFLLTLLAAGILHEGGSAYDASAAATREFGSSIGIATLLCTLVLFPTTAAAMHMGALATLPRTRKWLGPLIASTARLGAMLPSLVILFLILSATVLPADFAAWFARSVLSVPQAVLVVGCLLNFVVSLSPTIVDVTVRAVQALPPSLRTERPPMPFTRVQFVRSILLPNAMPAILPGIGVAVGRVCCDSAVLVWFFVRMVSADSLLFRLKQRLLIVEPMFVAILLMNIVAVWVLNKVVPRPHAPFPPGVRALP